MLHNILEIIEPNLAIINVNLEKNLMLVTALNKYIGYDNAALIAKSAHKSGKTLRETALEHGLISAADFDKFVVPLDMTKNS